MTDTDLVTSLKLQLAKYDAAIAEFNAVDAQLRMQAKDARVSDMLRVNREAINSMERSAELVKVRLSRALGRDSCAPF